MSESRLKTGRVVQIGALSKASRSPSWTNYSLWAPKAKQPIKYALVGAGSNLIAYCIYLLITFAGAGPLFGMTLVYMGSSVISFYGNSRWTFRANDQGFSQPLKYITIQIIGYATNLYLLSVLYKALGLSHQLAQLVSILLVAGELYLLSRYYVFKHSKPTK